MAMHLLKKIVSQSVKDQLGAAIKRSSAYEAVSRLYGSKFHKQLYAYSSAEKSIDGVPLMIALVNMSIPDVIHFTETRHFRDHNVTSTIPLDDCKPKAKDYQNKGDPRRINGKNMERKNVNAKGKSGGNQEGNNSKFNKEGFKFWDNSRFGALENLEEELEEETQEEYVTMERPDGPTGAILAGKGKRPQVQITEAQVLNDKAKTNRVNTARRQPTYKAKEGNRSTDKSKKQVNQAAKTENHTVVRGFDKENRVEKTMITKEGSRTEVFNFQAGMGDHHQDPPDGEQTTEDGSMGGPMADVVFAEGQCSSGMGGAEQ
nr:uncharacterized protein LOC109158743 [Ipomoea batatas]